MDNTTRLQYLEVMGIESWYPKTQPAIEVNVQSEVVTPSIEAELKIPLPVQEAPPQAVVITENKDTWKVLEQEVRQCQKCELHKTRTQTVFGTGNRDADWLFIGEAPNEDKDLQNQAFEGNPDKLLTEMIRAIGLQREEVFITNLLKCPLPDDQKPKTSEIEPCYDYLMRQKALVKPKIMVAVGRVAAQKLLKTTKTLKELRGIVHQIDNTPLIVMYHPAYLLRSLTQKRAAWQDLQLALNTYQPLEKV